jgi:hypothetical protein
VHRDFTILTRRPQCLAQIELVTQFTDTALASKDVRDRSRRCEPSGKCVLAHARTGGAQQLKQPATAEDIEICRVYMVRVGKALAGGPLPDPAIFDTRNASAIKDDDSLNLQPHASHAAVIERGGDKYHSRAYLGITMPSFPNFFLIYGPNTNLSHGGSAVFHSECQIRYIMLALRELIESGNVAMDVRPEPYWAYQEKVDMAHGGMVWSHPGVTSWYKNKAGRVTQSSPWRLVDYRDLTAEFNPADYRFTQAGEAAEVA